MKINILVIVISMVTVLFSSNSITAQSIGPNTIVIQPYIGAPNMKKWIYDINYDENRSSKGFGHVGLSSEIAISKRIGLGIDAIYSPFSRRENYNFSKYDQATDSFINIIESRKFDENKLRIIAKLYIHFNLENPNWDLYISGGMGANFLFRKAFIDGEEVNYEEHQNYNDNSIFFINPFPFSGRFCFGARYFFNEYLGINFELGVGGPPISFGLNVRF